jgi:hypothetical protein
MKYLKKSQEPEYLLFYINGIRLWINRNSFQVTPILWFSLHCHCATLFIYIHTSGLFVPHYLFNATSFGLNSHHQVYKVVDENCYSVVTLLYFAKRQFSSTILYTWWCTVRLKQVEVKLSLYRPSRPIRLREIAAPTFSDIRHTDGGKVVSLTRRPLFSPRKIPGTHFC